MIGNKLGLTNLLQKAEIYLFLLLILLVLLPIWNSAYFVTFDGPAHFYNVSILKSFFLQKKSILNLYFVLNKAPVPNIICHLIILFLSLIFKHFWVEKIFFTAYIIVFAFSFRLLIHKTNPHYKILSLTVFPFIYSYLFFMGFFNFCLSIPICLFALWYYFNNKELTLKTGVMLGLLGLLLIFSHIFSFVIYFIVMAMFLTVELANFLMTKEKAIVTTPSIFKKAAFFLLSTIPSLVVFVYYLNHNDTAPVRLPLKELQYKLFQAQPIHKVDYIQHSWGNNYAITLFITLFISIIFFSIKNKKHILISKYTWLFIVGALLGLYFLLPNEMSNGGYVSDRICMYIYLFSLILLASISTNAIVVALFTVVSVCYTLIQLPLYNTHCTFNSSRIEEFMEVNKYIEPNKTLLPLNNSNYFLENHHSNYLGIDKPLVVLENYEAATGYFPLLWDRSRCAYGMCPKLDDNCEMPNVRIDYVLTINMPDNTLDKNVNAFLTNKFATIYRSENKELVLYKRIY